MVLKRGSLFVVLLQCPPINPNFDCFNSHRSTEDSERGRVGTKIIEYLLSGVLNSQTTYYINSSHKENIANYKSLIDK